MRTINLLTKTLFIALAIVSTACGSKSNSQQDNEKSAQTATEENWIQLFNGEDLIDWQLKFTGY
jgi:hypothetical protein